MIKLFFHCPSLNKQSSDCQEWRRSAHKSLLNWGFVCRAHCYITAHKYLFTLLSENTCPSTGQFFSPPDIHLQKGWGTVQGAEKEPPFTFFIPCPLRNLGITGSLQMLKKTQDALYQKKQCVSSIRLCSVCKGQALQWGFWHKYYLAVE